MTIIAEQRYPSLVEMANAVAERPDSDFTSGAEKEGSGESWDFGVGFQGALDLARQGWPEGLEAIKEAHELIYGILAPRIKHQEVEYALDGGAFIDVGRFCSGEPECFGVFHEVEKIQNKPITVIINATCSGSVSAQNIRNRGAAIAAAVDVLEQTGYSCEVVMINFLGPLSFGGGQDERTLIRTVVKQAGEVVDLDSMAFALTHPAYQRRLVFGAQDKFDDSIRRRWGFEESGGYGNMYEYTDSHEERNLYFRRLGMRDSSWSTIQSSANAIMGMLEKYGLILEDGSER